jgi:hypothetical protein
MSITGIAKVGLFEAYDCPYSATAILAVKEMQDFGGKSCDGKAKVVVDALKNKHPSLKWYVACFKDGSSSRTEGSNSLWFNRNGFWFDIVIMHDQAKIDKIAQNKELQIVELNTGK